ncbi:hypothetical protein ACOZ4L_16600 (plasmid) [Haloplanus ruber]|uniref:Uncharacterized protein n=1 Tax=Haloplanus ruber TaxID=869892 RepID=A0ABD6D263_9EURY|nr:hypothetical protein [Haloplanus ruber]
MDRRDVVGLLLTMPAIGAQGMKSSLSYVLRKEKKDEDSQSHAQEGEKVEIRVEIKD